MAAAGAGAVLALLAGQAAAAAAAASVGNSWFPDSVLNWAFPTSFAQQITDGEEFDYIVVGAGAAGCAAAARLAEAGHSVLLAEAGGDPSLLSRMPAAKYALLGSSLDWQYKTISNGVSCLSYEDKQCPFHRGKCLGGSTAINFMMYTRGQPADYELGLPGWTWQDFRPFFLKYEGLQDLRLLPSSSISYHNTTGVMLMGFFDDPQNPWQNRIIKGFKWLNIPFNEDVNAKSQIGVTKLIGYVHDGERMTTARGYLTLTGLGAKMNISKGAKCTGVVFDKNKDTRGVTLLDEGVLKTVYAKQEVVLSAGTVGTPQLLMLSGVGHADHLKSFDIPVQADLPVGDNMSDHVTPLIFILVERDFAEIFFDSLDAILQAGKWIVNDKFDIPKNGRWASNPLTDITMFVNTSCYDFKKRQLELTGPGCDIPTSQAIIEYMERGLLVAGERTFQQSLRLNNNITDQLVNANIQGGLIIINPVVLKPYSRGTVRLSSKNPLDDPAIYPNYLDDERDVDELVRMITIIEHLVESPDFADNMATILYLELPSCPSHKHGKPATAEYWRCYVRHLTSSVYHATGTSALGPVLDARMRVRGVQRLRVADLSALPEVPRGNTASAAIALGERVADFLLHDHTQKT